MMTRAGAVIVAVVVGWGVGGCGHVGTAEKAAATALIQLSKYETEVGNKIRTETEYYDSVMDAASTRINDLWSNEQPFKLEQDAKTFTLANQRSQADDVGAKLAAFMEGVVDRWAGRDAQYQTLMTETTTALTKSRKVLELEKAKIGQLRNKLATLSQAASDQEMLTLAIGFVKETRDRFEELSEQATKAPAAPK
jgi:hypothetical protein